ncbi:MAG: hypothetical protein AB203_00485 [Parcubacteria bacterium C7867-008]|nr:MAG: hypothetical protein AB203_00485 [Parcubacteria bacterium C7867-008]
MSSIRIVSTPPGSIAPVGVRKEWVGVEIPLATKEDFLRVPMRGTPCEQHKDVHIVLRSKAIDALRTAGREGVAVYWDREMFGDYLQFTKKCCEVVE